MGNNTDNNTLFPLDENSEVRKSRALIFAQTTPSNLPIAAQRLFLALLANINDDTSDDDNTFIIKGKDIAALSNLSPNVVGQQLEEMTIKSDMLRQFTLTIKEDDGNDLRTGLISSSKYIKGQRAIRISVDKFLMPHLKRMKQQFDISYAISGPMKFRSEYSIRLYEIMNYYSNEGSHYFTLQEIRKLFNIADGKIPLTSTLNQKVIAPSMRDINNFTNMEITVEHKKRGRTIIGYTFTVKDKNPRLSNNNNNNNNKIQANEDEEFITKLLSAPYSFNKNSLFMLINKYGLNSIKNNFRYTEEHKPKNFSAYLFWAITNQVYEKQLEIAQIEAVNKAYAEDNIPLPIFENTDEINETVKVDEEKMKEENPQMYEIMMRIKQKIK